jgi:hypothetical protein
MTDAPEGGFQLTDSAAGDYPGLSDYYYPTLRNRLFTDSDSPTDGFPIFIGYSVLRQGLVCGDANAAASVLYSIIDDSTSRNITLNLQYAYVISTDTNNSPAPILGENATTLIVCGFDDQNFYSHLLVCPNTGPLPTDSNLFYVVDFDDPADIFYSLQNNGTYFLLAGEDGIGPYVRKCLNSADPLDPDNWIRFAQPTDCFFNCLFPIPNSTVWLAGGTNAGGYEQIWKSTDGGQTWTAVTMGDLANDEVICAITSLDGHFVAVTPYGNAYITDDIDVWGDVISIGGVQVKDPLFYNNKALAVGNGFFVYAASDDIYYSDDNGATWTANGSLIADCFGVCFNLVEGKFYLTTYDGAVTANIYSSADPSDSIDLLSLVFNYYQPANSPGGQLAYSGTWVKY